MTKPVIVRRLVKASSLTYEEHDTNFQNLADATVSLKAGTGGTDVVSDLNGVITLVAGDNIEITGDNSAKTISFLVRNNTFGSSIQKDSFAPEFVKTNSTNGAIQRITVGDSEPPSFAATSVTVINPTGMTAGDRMRLLFVRTEAFVTGNSTVTIAGDYRVANNSQHRYFEQHDSTPRVFNLEESGDAMCMEILFDGVDHFVEVHSDYV